MSTASHIWISIGVMFIITFTLRALPLFERDKLLSSEKLRTINQSLPLCIMVILALHSLLSPAMTESIGIRFIALILVIKSYWLWGNTLLSITTGIALITILKLTT
jgi:branched-subunit amino acid transport protein AzlD